MTDKFKGFEIWEEVNTFVTTTKRDTILLGIIPLVESELETLDEKLNYDYTNYFKVKVNGRIGKRLSTTLTLELYTNCLCMIKYLELQRYIRTVLESIKMYASDISNKDVKVYSKSKDVFEIQFNFYF